VSVALRLGLFAATLAAAFTAALGLGAVLGPVGPAALSGEAPAEEHVPAGEPQPANPSPARPTEVPGPGG
jgi:hypothetical protein